MDDKDGDLAQITDPVGGSNWLPAQVLTDDSPEEGQAASIPKDTVTAFIRNPQTGYWLKARLDTMKDSFPDANLSAVATHL